MYIKLSFIEEKVIIPCVWGGLFVFLLDKPKIVESLPLTVRPFQCVEFTSDDNKDAPNYNYYYDCGNISKEVIKKAIQRFDGPLFENETQGMCEHGYYLPDENVANMKFFSDKNRLMVANNPFPFIKHLELSLAQFTESPVEAAKKNPFFTDKLMSLFANQVKANKIEAIDAAKTYSIKP